MESVEALWIAHFGDVFTIGTGDVFTAGTSNGGVVVFETGRVFGGDSGFFYLGEYDVSGDILSAKVTITRFKPGVPSVFGWDIDGSRRIEIRGQREADLFICEMWAVDQPNTPLPLVLKRVAELP